MTQPTANLTLSLARSGGASLGLSLSTGTSAVPPVVGSALWLDALRPGTLFQDAARTTLAGVGDPVGSWFDPDAGIGATQSGAARPVRAAAGLTFDGVNDFLDAAIGARPQPETIYIVLQASGLSTSQITPFDGVSGVNTGRMLSLGFAGFDHLTLFSGVALQNAARPYGSRVVAAAVFNGVSSVLHVNSVSVSGNAGTNTGTGLRIGISGAGAEPMRGEIAMVLRYAAAHTASQRDAIIAWAAARHGVTL